MKLLKNIILLILIVFLSLFTFSGKTKNSAEEIQKQIVSGNNKFALELYSSLRAKEGNLFFSPYSISTALGMTYAGAQGETAGQMAEVLNFPEFVERNGCQNTVKTAMQTRGGDLFHRAYGDIIRDLNKRGKKGNYQLSVANALWGQQDFKFLQSYLELVEEHYGGKLDQVDFTDAQNREKTRQRINKWVEQETEEKIKDLISKGDLDPLTRLVLTNAIYFKGKWSNEFDEEQTRRQPFHLADGGEVEVDLMHRKGKYRYAQTEDMQLLELDYQGDDISMLVLLPKKKIDINGVEKELTPDNLSEWLDKLTEKEVTVFLPRFKVTEKFRLNNALSSMGMNLAFTGRADFSGMTGGRDLYISAVIHKAFVEVNEEGTEAAAATGVVMRLTSVGPEQIIFRADRPFIFLIREKVTGSILFLGRLTKPPK